MNEVLTRLHDACLKIQDPELRLEILNLMSELTGAVINLDTMLSDAISDLKLIISEAGKCVDDQVN